MAAAQLTDREPTTEPLRFAMESTATSRDACSKLTLRLPAASSVSLTFASIIDVASLPAAIVRSVRPTMDGGAFTDRTKERVAIAPQASVALTVTV